MNKRQIALETISAILVLLFLYASISKFLDFQRFTGEMNNQPFPNSWTPFLVWIIPSLEIAIALTLIFERTRMTGLVGALVLMTLFTLYSGAILFHLFSYVPCFCGGMIWKLTWPEHQAFNLFFVGLSVMGIILQQRRSIPLAEFVIH